MPTRNLRDGVLTIYGKITVGPWGPNTTIWHTIALDAGDLSWTETQNVIEVMDRGVLDHIRKGDEAPVDLSFSLKYQNLYGAGAAATTAYEAIKGVGEADTWRSVRDEDVYCVSLDFQVFNTSDTLEETVSFHDFYHTSIEFAEGDEYNTLSVTGRSFAVCPSVS